MLRNIFRRRKEQEEKGPKESEVVQEQEKVCRLFLFPEGEDRKGPHPLREIAGSIYRIFATQIRSSSATPEKKWGEGSLRVALSQKKIPPALRRGAFISLRTKKQYQGSIQSPFP